MTERNVCVAVKARMTVGRACVDLASRLVRDARGTVHRLTPTERDLLRLLDAARGRVFRHDEILTFLRGEGVICDNNALYVHCANLRRKLGGSATYLVNHRGEGYSLL